MKAALSLARELNIEVVVEGVETVAQLELLKAWGGRIVQGFYFARPLPVPEVTALLRIGRIASVQTELAGVAILTAARRIEPPGLGDFVSGWEDLGCTSYLHRPRLLHHYVIVSTMRKRASPRIIRA